MRKYIILLALFLLVGCQNQNNLKEYITEDKPVIYLYPDEPMNVKVQLEYNGDFICTYPKYNNGWEVKAHPDGTLINTSDNKEYSYLFWEGKSHIQYDLSEGYVVKGEDTAKFLQDTLSKMGLTPQEYNEFIVYWLPRMQNNPYNLITFQKECYTDNAKLHIYPKPDHILRVFMVYQALNEPIQIDEPVIEPFIRSGFVVVEWGGTQIK